MKNNLAVAYAIKRRNQMKAKGGMIENEKLHPEHEPEKYADGGEVSEDKRRRLRFNLGPSEEMDADSFMDQALDPLNQNYNPTSKMEHAKGGMIHNIMMKRKMAEGGEVDADHPMPDSSDNAYKATGPLINRRSKEEMRQTMASRIGTKPYAEGGYVDDMDLNDQELDPDRFLAEHMPNQDEGRHVSALDDTDSEDAHMKKNKLLSKILAGVRSRHMSA